MMTLDLIHIGTVLLLCLLNDVICVENLRPVVQTDKGLVQGYAEFTLGKRVDKFLGIPFAKPPLGELRFKPPVQADPWEGTLDASQLPNTCMQLMDTYFGDFTGSTMWNANTKISEDCLYLSVWVPKTNPPYENKPVMVFIYGGSFTSGTHTLDIYNTNYLVVENDVIVVAMQYRVGALGFFAMDTPEAPGNAGLWDQHMALQWVSRNIRQFGGNPNSVTLVSESAGSASVGHHLLCEVCGNLFHRAILQSGAPEASWAVLSRDEMQRRSDAFAKKLNCHKDGDPDYSVQCMRDKDANLFPPNEYMTDGISHFPFIPVVDGVFVRNDPKYIMRKGMFKKVPILLGSNANEITFFLVYHDSVFDMSSSQLEINGKMYRRLLPSLFKYYPHYPHKLNQFGHEAIHYRYTNWLNSDDKNAFRQSIDSAASDYYFVCPVNRFARAYSRHGLPVYYYWFDQRWSSNPWPEWMGVLHGDEFWFTFGQALNDSHSFTDEEKELSRTMMRYWTNFAKTGNPNKAPGKPETKEWPRFHHNEQLYINLSTKTMASGKTWGQGPRTQECAFWDYYLPKLVFETNEAKRSHDEELVSWRTTFISDWKTEFNNFIQNYQTRAATNKCNSEGPGQ